MACEVTFMGGPADGQTRILPKDEPPAVFTVAVGPERWDLPPSEFEYVRQVSALDDGPLWVYVPASAGLGKP